MTCAPSEDSDQPGHPPSLIRVFACAQWVAYDPSVLHTDSKDSDQTRRTARLIWVLAGRTFHFFVWSCAGSLVFLHKYIREQPPTGPVQMGPTGPGSQVIGIDAGETNPSKQIYSIVSPRNQGPFDLIMAFPNSGMGFGQTARRRKQNLWNPSFGDRNKTKMIQRRFHWILQRPLHRTKSLFLMVTYKCINRFCLKIH